MTNKCNFLLISLTIIILFPSICFSKSVTVQGEHCDSYLGDLKNKKELERFRKDVRRMSLELGVSKITTSSKSLEYVITDECFDYVIDHYLEKIVVISHSENGRKICDKVKITLDPEVVIKYFRQEICIHPMNSGWCIEVDRVLSKFWGINIGLIIETSIKGLDSDKKEQLENEQERQFYSLIETNKEQYRLVDRRHMNKVIEEQKFSMSGLTDNETVKLGKLLNLDVIVLRMIYENSMVTKVLKVDTGEVMLFKTYEK